MFCPKCGTQLPDDVKYCSKCGNSVGEDLSLKSKRANTHYSSQNTGITKKGIYILVILVAIILLIAVVKKVSSARKASKNVDNFGNSFNGDESNYNDDENQAAARGGASNYEDVVNEYFNAALDKDAERFINCHPVEMRSELENMYWEARGSDAFLSGLFSFLDRNEDLDYTYTIGGASKLPQSNIDDIESKYGFKIEEAYKVDADVYYQQHADYGFSSGTITRGKGDPETVIVGKVDGSWYIIGDVDTSIWEWR